MEDRGYRLLVSVMAALALSVVTGAVIYASWSNFFLIVIGFTAMAYLSFTPAKPPQ